MGERVLPLVISLRLRHFSSRAFASGTQPSVALSASVCFGEGTRSARIISRADSERRQVRSVGQDRPPPILSIRANDGDAFSAKSLRISVELSGLAFRQMLS